MSDCPHCDPVADGGVTVTVRVTSYERHQARCPTLGHHHTETEDGPQEANQRQHGPIHEEESDD